MLCPHLGMAMSLRLGAQCSETRFDADMEEALVSSKLDAIGQEYNLLLAGQLEEQRRWYEGRNAQVHMVICILHAQSTHGVRRSWCLRAVACFSSSLRAGSTMLHSPDVGL